MDFQYVRAESVDHALDTLGELGEDAVVIAGGQSLLNILKQGLMAPETVVDIKGLGSLDYVDGDETRGLRIGAVTTHRTVETSDLVRQHLPVLSEMERHLASVQVRNWGTLGGNLCIADPTSDAAPVLMALGSEVLLKRSGGERTVAVNDFFVDYYETVLEEGELLTEIRVPALPARAGAAYEKFRNVEGDAPIVVASSYLKLAEDGKTVEEVRIALGGVSSTPVRATGAEDLLRGAEATDERIAEAARAVAQSTSPIPDIVCSAEYKVDISTVLARRTLGKAASRARGT
jgi:carbon-monoxide dehydrogenase medium subunit